jgi:hypothetical protein
VGNAWHVFPLTPDLARNLAEVEGVPPPSATAAGTAPTPNQVFAALGPFPEYRVIVRRWDRKEKEKGQFVYIKLLRADGPYAITINLLGAGDDRPAGAFAFEYYRETEDLVRFVSRLPDSCGPLVLYHDGGEAPVVIAPSNAADPGAAPDRGDK